MAVCTGANRWPAVHRLAAARLFRLVLEQGVAGASYHSIAGEGIPMRELMTAISRHLGLLVVPKSPAEALDAGQPACSAGCPASSALKQQLGWHPSRPGLLAGLERGYYLSQPLIRKPRIRWAHSFGRGLPTCELR